MDKSTQLIVINNCQKILKSKHAITISERDCLYLSKISGRSFVAGITVGVNSDDKYIHKILQISLLVYYDEHGDECADLLVLSNDQKVFSATASSDGIFTATFVDDSDDDWLTDLNTLYYMS